MSKQTPAQTIAAKLIALLEQGVTPWTCPWDCRRASGLPLRSTGEAYRGINTLLLWIETAAKGYAARHWMTYKQAAVLRGQVRKGETGTMVVYYGTAADNRGDTSVGGGEEGASRYRFLKSFVVFNCDQIDGLPEQFAVTPPRPVETTPERIARLDAAFARLDADLRHGGTQAFFTPSGDFIQMPEFRRFRDAEQYYATLFHETAHWSGAATRLNRDFGKKFGDPKYRSEECVAEVTSALVGSVAGLRPEHIHNHAAYLEHWIGALKDDPNFILKMAGLAQTAADYILERTGLGAPEASDEPNVAIAA